MAIVPREWKTGGVTYYVTFTWQKRTVWERSGKNKREAESLESERKRQVEAGTYSPSLPRGSRTTVEGWFAGYFASRTNRSISNDISLIENHVLSREWFAKMRLGDLEPRIVLRLVEQIRRESELGEKSVAIIVGIMRGAFRRAVFERVLDADPTQLPRGEIKWKSRRKRRPYTREEVKTLVRDSRIPWDARVFIALAFYTGMREGEICALRWSNWDKSWEPLTALDVAAQYEDKPLKTDDGDDTHARRVPVHPELYDILSAWQSEGFELFHLRAPVQEDRIVPHRRLGTHSKSSAYKAFQRALLVAKVENRTLHSTRHTFISVARSNGAPSDVIEQITHNARGSVIDDYTTFEWLALCKAVALFDVSVDPNRTRAFLELQRLDSNRGDAQGKRWNRRDLTGERGNGNSGEDGPSITWGALFDARQRKLLALAEADPAAARPGLALCRGLESAYRLAAGDDAAIDDIEVALADAELSLGDDSLGSTSPVCKSGGGK
jgi:integrase